MCEVRAFQRVVIIAGYIQMKCSSNSKKYLVHPAPWSEHQRLRPSYSPTANWNAKRHTSTKTKKPDI